MKTANLFAVLLVLCASSTNAQTVGDSYDYIKSKEPGGKFKRQKGGFSTYYVLDRENTCWIYFIGRDRICNALSFFPETIETFDSYVELFNENWIIVEDYHWKFERENSSTLYANIDEIENVGPVFYISASPDLALQAKDQEVLSDK